MELLDLRYFVEAARRFSFTRAAEAMFITQPTLSRRIQRFERELGVRLFEREPQSVALTQAGQALLPQAELILGQCEAIPAIVLGSSPSPTQVFGTVNVGYQESVDMRVMLDAIKSLALHQPGVRVEPSRLAIRTIPDALSSGRADAVFIVSNRFFKLEGISFKKLDDCEFMLLALRDSSYGERPAIHMRDLADAEFIMCDRDVAPGYYDSFTSQCIMNGFMMHHKYHVDTLEEAAFMVSAGMGVALILSNADIMDDLPVRGLVAVHIEGADCSNDFGIAWRTDNDRPALQVFLDEVTALAL